MTAPRKRRTAATAPSTRRRSRLSWSEAALFLLLCGGAAWLLARGGERLAYHWQWYRVPRYLLVAEEGRLAAGPLLDGLLVTFRIAGLSLLLALLAGLSAALLRLSPSWVGRALARAYLEGIRNTPLLVQLFFAYFVLGPLLDLDRFWAAVLALGFFEGAYLSEIFRAGILAIPRGQWEAARSLGLSTWICYRRVVLPQSLRLVLPPATGQSVSLIKDSALVSTVAVTDLTLQGQVIIAETFLTFEIWFTVAAIYLLLTASLSAAAGAIENRLRPHP
jgi:polar amino acid transport system permease protein